MGEEIIDDKKKLDAFEEGKLVDNFESEEILKRARRDEKLKKIVAKSKPSKKIEASVTTPNNSQIKQIPKSNNPQTPTTSQTPISPQTPAKNKGSKKGLVILAVGLLIILIGAVILVNIWKTPENPKDDNQTIPGTEDLTIPEDEIPPLLPPENTTIGENVSIQITGLKCSKDSVSANISVSQGSIDGLEFTLLVDGLVEVSSFVQKMNASDTREFKIDFVEDLENVSLIERLSVSGIINEETTPIKATRYCN